MVLESILLFIIGFILGGVSLYLYSNKKVKNLKADILDKRLINQLIKDYVDKMPKGSNSRKRRYNGRQKTKKAKTTSRQTTK